MLLPFISQDKIYFLSHFLRTLQFSHLYLWHTVPHKEMELGLRDRFLA